MCSWTTNSSPTGGGAALHVAAVQHRAVVPATTAVAGQTVVAARRARPASSWSRVVWHQLATG